MLNCFISPLLRVFPDVREEILPVVVESRGDSSRAVRIEMQWQLLS